MNKMDQENGKEKINDAAPLIPVQIMGQIYEVPERLTIMKAVEYAGHQYIRGCGCRGGICGACGTFYRMPGDYQLRSGLACQTVIEPGMMIMQLPYVPVNRQPYDLDSLNKNGSAVSPENLHESVRALFPEVFRCVGCATCSRACPMEIDVMDYVALIGRGDLEKAAEISFSCVMCGLCAIRCPAQISQHTTAMYVRRLTGRFLIPPAEHLKIRVEEIRSGKYDEMISRIKSISKDEFKKIYAEREREPDMSEPGTWKPKEKVMG